MLPCEECTKTKNHCCVADVPHHITDAMYYKHMANELGIECLVVPTPNPQQQGMVVLVQEHMRGKDIHFEPCIFFIDRKCAIYDNRPTICRSYGGATIPCIFEANNFFTSEQIEAITQDEMRKMTQDLNLENIYNKVMDGDVL